MRIVVIGAGQVGSSIAESLAGTHEVVVVDIDTERVDSLTYSLDVLAIQGDGASLSTLSEAGVEDADMLIATTDDDETNIVTCSTAKTVSDAFTIARVKTVEYLNTWQRSAGAFGVDFMVCTPLLTAEAIVRVIGLPAARDADSFADGRVQMAELKVPEESPVANQTVRDADRFESLTFAAILRDDDVEIPTGETVIQPNDQLVVIGSPENVQAFASVLAPDESLQNGRDIVVIGGSDTGYHTARLLGARGLNPRLVEQDPVLARELAEQLPNTVVMENDPTDIDFLTKENVDKADVVVAALNGDERNLLVSLLAKRLGAERTIAVVESGEYVNLFETVGVDVAVNPREATAEEITRFTREEQAENVALIENDRAEVVEIEIDGESALAGRTIREGVSGLPDGVVIGAITRDGEFVTPRGDTVVERGDHVVVFVNAEIIDEVTAKL